MSVYEKYPTRSLLDALVFIDPRTATAAAIGDELARRCPDRDTENDHGTESVMS